MHWNIFSSWLLLSTYMLLTKASPTPTPTEAAVTDEIDRLQAVGMKKLEAWLAETEGSEVSESEKVKRTTTGKCSLFNFSVRKEWSTLSNSERKAYINAMLCLQSKPSKSDPSVIPGARSRYDDFVGVHIQQTLNIHGTTNFLPWHRYFTWTFEQALRQECGYKGYQPYWNWGITASDPLGSAMFDGSAYSMSGNGEYVAHRGPEVGGGLIQLPAGLGGGCVSTGPFKNMTVNLGPVAPVLEGVDANGDGLSYNPRCLRRDINPYVAAKWTNTAEIVKLIIGNNDMYWFQTLMQGDFAAGFLGVHSGGHFTIGGDPGGDLFASPADPAFFMHHAMIDRVWWIWQTLNLPERLHAVSGTITINNMPPSRNGTLDDTLELGVNAPANVTIRELMNTVDGPFCYIYL